MYTAVFTILPLFCSVHRTFSLIFQDFRHKTGTKRKFPLLFAVGGDIIMPLTIEARERPRSQEPTGDDSDPQRFRRIPASGMVPGWGCREYLPHCLHICRGAILPTYFGYTCV